MDPKQISGVMGKVDGKGKASDQESISSQVLEIEDSFALIS